MDTVEISLDANSRITIPKKLLQKITDKKELQLVAQDDRIEIWNPETYIKNFDEDQFQELADELFGKPEEETT